MNRNNGAQSSCVLLTMIISGCQHCWLWGFKIFPVPTQTSLPFPSFPSTNRAQAALHYREACPSVCCERLSRIFTTWCVHAGMQHLWTVLLTSTASTCTKTGLWLHRGHLVQLEVIFVEEDLCSAQRGAKHSCWAGHFYSSRKLLVMESHCPSQYHIPLGKSGPLPFVVSSLFLVPWISAFEKSPNLHWNLTPLWQPLSWWSHVRDVWFQAHHRPGFKCKPFNRVKLTVPTSLQILPDLLSVFWALCCFGGEFIVQKTVPLD